MKANDLVVLALRSPLHLLMGDTMLITVTGLKTGRKITVPVNYYRDGSNLWILSSRDRTWWRNLRRGAHVELHLHGQNLAGFGEVLLDERAVATRLSDYVRKLPGSARHFGISVAGGVANPDQVRRAARERLFVRVCLD